MNAEPKKAAEQPRPSLRKALKGAPQRLWRLIYHNWPWKLLALFLAGLSTYGAPVTVLVPIFFGLGVGLTEAYYYGAGRPGILFVALLVVPRTLIAATALLMGCSESLRMSLLLSGQLLPNAHCGGLWLDFRLYCVRFLVFFGLAFAAGVVDVCLRLACYSWFT